MNQIFNYWNSFVLGWINRPFGPNYLYNTSPDSKTGKKDYSKDYSEDYIPEPWWGNCGDDDTPLYSVCLNLNPGKGDTPLQTRSNKNLVAINRYQDVFKELPATDNWHETKRAQPIAEVLKTLKAIPNTHNRALDHHLSVELIPWHTEHATAELGFWSYVENEIADIFNYSFMLAAEESERITTGPLKKTVLMRFSESTANLIFKKFCKRGLISSMPSSKHMTGLSDPNVHATIFTFPNEPRLSGHRFVAIWRSKGYRLNDFPKQHSMVEIFRQL